MTRNKAKKDHNAGQEENCGAERIREAVRVEMTKEQIKWTTLQDMTYILRSELINDGVGVVYVVCMEESTSEPQEVRYWECDKSWRTVAGEELPEQAVKWLSHHNKVLHDRAQGPAILTRWCAVHAAAPWLKEPLFVSQVLQKSGSPDVAELQGLLNYRFRNTMLLAQALTHPSAVGALTPCYQRLAAVGEAVVEFYVTRRLVGGAPLSGGKCAATALPLDGCSAQPVPLSDSRLPSRRVGSGARGSAVEAGSDDFEE